MTECDYPGEVECDEYIAELIPCLGCGSIFEICAAHFGYRMAYQNLGPPCPNCGARDVSESVDALTPFDYLRPYSLATDYQEQAA